MNPLRWIDREITPEQVSAELEPVKPSVETALIAAEVEIGQVFSTSSAELTENRQLMIPQQVALAYQPQETTPTEVLLACAGEALQEAEVSRGGRVAFVSD